MGNDTRDEQSFVDSKATVSDVGWVAKKHFLNRVLVAFSRVYFFATNHRGYQPERPDGGSIQASNWLIQVATRKRAEESWGKPCTFFFAHQPRSWWCSGHGKLSWDHKMVTCQTFGDEQYSTSTLMGIQSTNSEKFIVGQGLSQIQWLVHGFKTSRV